MNGNYLNCDEWHGNLKFEKKMTCHCQTDYGNPCNKAWYKKYQEAQQEAIARLRTSEFHNEIQIQCSKEYNMNTQKDIANVVYTQENVSLQQTLWKDKDSDH